MNIVTPVPTNIVFTTANVNTEAARRDNVQRETIPQSTEAESSAAESGLGSESDRVKSQGRPQQPVTYERFQNGQNQAAQSQGDPAERDNAEDPSAGRENAETRQEQQQQAAEKREVDELKRRDQEVRAHEQAHASVGGQYAGSPSYDYQTGPDGRQYAVGGEVSIDISEERSPEDTLRKMQQVRAAALAPAEPSAQDLRVASEATQKAVEARGEISQQAQEELEKNQARQRGEVSPTDELTPELDEIVRGGGDSGGPKRALNEDADPVAEAAGLETSGDEFRARLANRDSQILQRVSVIEGFYQDVATPKAGGLQISA